MKICWDNIEGLVYTRGGNLCSKDYKRFYYFKVCKLCKEDFLGTRKETKFCVPCANIGENNGMFGKKSPGFSGRKHTKEYRKYMKEVNKGKANPFYGKTHDRKTLEKMSGENHHMFGKTHSKETRDKISRKTAGQNNPQWKGGISAEPYCFVWRDKEYKDSIKERDDYICQNPLCLKNCYHLPMVLHHIDYNKKNCHPDNLITLCKSCNSKANFGREFWENLYKTILSGGIYDKDNSSVS